MSLSTQNWKKYVIDELKLHTSWTHHYKHVYELHCDRLTFRRANWVLTQEWLHSAPQHGHMTNIFLSWCTPPHHLHQIRIHSVPQWQTCVQVSFHSGKHSDESGLKFHHASKPGHPEPLRARMRANRGCPGRPAKYRELFNRQNMLNIAAMNLQGEFHIWDDGNTMVAYHQVNV